MLRLGSFLRDLRDVLRIALNPETWAAILDEWTSRARERAGQEPDWDVERRRARRRREEPGKC